MAMMMMMMTLMSKAIISPAMGGILLLSIGDEVGACVTVPSTVDIPDDGTDTVLFAVGVLVDGTDVVSPEMDVYVVVCDVINLVSE